MEELDIEVEIELGELPQGWSWSTLGKVCEKPQYGWTTKADKENGKIKLLRTTDISPGDIDWNSVPYCTEEPDDLDKYLIESGDIVISRAGSVGVSYLLTEVEPAVFASYLIRFRPKSGIDERYLYHYLQSSTYWTAIGASKAGIAVPNVNAKKLARVPFPLAPLPEQRRIVEAIELQLGRLDAAVARLHAAKAKLKRYRQAVLKAAVEGRLFNEELDEGELPAGWEWTTLGDAVELVSGGTPKGVNDAKNEGAIPFFKVGDMTLDGNDRYMETSRAYLSEQDAKRLKLTIYPAGTVIFPKRGGAILTNKKRVLSGPGAFDLNLMGALPSATIDSDFLYYWFEQLDLSKIYDGSNIPQINKKNVDPLPFVKPPITEQRRIADELDRLLDSTNEMETTLDAQLAQSTRLRQAVLKRAFEGRLV